MDSAIGRLSVLLYVYGIVALRTPDAPLEKLANNWGDLHYALLTTYTRHICTKDRGLKEVLTAMGRGKYRFYDSLDLAT